MKCRSATRDSAKSTSNGPSCDPMECQSATQMHRSPVGSTLNCQFGQRDDRCGSWQTPLRFETEPHPLPKELRGMSSCHAFHHSSSCTDAPFITFSARVSPFPDVARWRSHGWLRRWSGAMSGSCRPHGVLRTAHCTSRCCPPLALDVCALPHARALERVARGAAQRSPLVSHPCLCSPTTMPSARARFSSHHNKPPHERERPGRDESRPGHAMRGTSAAARGSTAALRSPEPGPPRRPAAESGCG